MASNITSSPWEASLINCTVSAAAPLTSYILAGVVVAASCLLGVPANVAIIVQLGRHVRGSTMTQRLFFSLALSDLLCLLCLPLGLYLFYSGTCLMDGLGQGLLYYFIFCITTDLNILVLISIQRYYQVLRPDKWAKVHRTWQRVLLSSVWLLGAVVALPAVFMTKEEAPKERACNKQGIDPGLEAAYISFVAASYLVLFSFYLLLVQGVKRTRMPNRKPPRATKIFIRIIAVYLLVGFFPVLLRILYVAALFTESAKLLCVSRTLTFVECFYFFNHCLNPFLYFYASRHSRDGNRNHLLNDN